MAKPQVDFDDVLGEDAPAPAKKAKKAATKAEAAPTAKKTKKVKAEEAEPEVVEKAARAPREPVTFEEGERDELVKRIKKMVKKDINSRDLATKLEIPTRKLRTVLYSMQKRAEISLTPSESRVAGMTVSPA